MPGRARAVLIGVLLACLGIASVELVLRGRATSSPTKFRFRSNFPAKSVAGLLVEHPSRFYALRADRRSGVDVAGRYACGAWPFRGRPPVSEPGAEWPTAYDHVLVLGDSCVFGQGLDVDETLPAFLERSLPGTKRAHVTNLGVPGYSIVQIRALLHEVLARVAPRVVVLYPGAWNDQAVAMGASDVELAAMSRSVLERSALVRRLREWTRSTSDDAGLEATRSERMAAFEAGDVDVPRRVPLDDYLRLLDEVHAACATRGAKLVVVAPAHPRSTMTRFPMTRTYAKRTLAWARARGIEHLDGQSVCDAAALDDDALFLDFVHPTPLLMKPLGEAVARLVAQHLEASAPSDPEPWTAQPLSVSSLGDEWIEVAPAESDATESVRLVAIGSVPLLDVEALPNGRLRGRTLTNTAGTYPVRVFGEHGWVETTARLQLAPPTIEFAPDAPARIIARSRPGDRFVLRAATELRPTPEWTPQGPNWLPAEQLVPRTLELICDQNGVARVEFPSLGDGDLLHAQALVFPNGVSVDRSLARYTAPIRIRLR